MGSGRSRCKEDGKEMGRRGGQKAQGKHTLDDIQHRDAADPVPRLQEGRDRARDDRAAHTVAYELCGMRQRDIQMNGRKMGKRRKTYE